MEQDIIYKKARKRVEAKLGFLTHLAIYILVNAFLITLNLLQGHDVIWSAGPVFGWGIGILFHALGVFVFSKFSHVKEALIRKEINRISADS